METKKASISYGRKFAQLFIMLFSVMIVVGFLYGPVTRILEMRDYESSPLQTARIIGLSLYAYAADHNGHYPEGKTSTEVFQHLLDEEYVTDPQIFYASNVAMPGKTNPQNGHLKPENVCWDVTCCVDASAPDTLPLVFLTGYKVTYQAGASAQPIVAFHGRTWWQWFSRDRFWRPFMAVHYKSNSARGIEATDDGSIPNFIPADFDPKGKVYRQLTP